MTKTTNFELLYETLNRLSYRVVKLLVYELNFTTLQPHNFMIRTRIRVFSERITADSGYEELPSFWVDPMPFVPRQNEQVRIEDLMDAFTEPFASFTERQWATVYELEFTVDHVTYCKDEQGYYVSLLLKGE